MDNIDELNKKLNDYQLIIETLKKQISLYEISSKLDYEKINNLLKQVDEYKKLFG